MNTDTLIIALLYPQTRMTLLSILIIVLHSWFRAFHVPPENCADLSGPHLNACLLIVLFVEFRRKPTIVLRTAVVVFFATITRFTVRCAFSLPRPIKTLLTVQLWLTVSMMTTLFAILQARTNATLAVLCLALPVVFARPAILYSSGQ